MSSSPTAPAVEVAGLVKNYGKVEALRGIDLSIAKGEMFALLGPNGAGKTTLFSILSTLRTPTAGTALVLGRDVVVERDATRRDIGIVFQEPAIERTLSVRDNLGLMGRLYGLDTKAVRRRTEELLTQLQLTEAAERPAQNLSGGQRRRVELARALVTDPRVLFLDEATLGLDVEARRDFWKQVRGLTKTGRTIVFATHYMEEAEVADRIALIAEGKIVALDTPRNLKARLGGGVIRLHTADDAQAREWLAQRGYQPAPGVEPLMLEHKDPASIVPILLRELPVKVERVEIHSPSLEDVFLKLTGRALSDETTATPPAGKKGGLVMIRGIWAIVMLDMQRFFKERARLIAGLIQPLLYLFVLGSGLGASMRMGPPGGAPGGAPVFDYRAFIYPGVISLSLLFSATFAGITIVFDRQIGFFKAVLVAPVPRAAIGIGKVVSGALQALMQGLVLLCFLPVMKIEVSVMSIVWVMPAMILAALTFSALGVAMAARFTSTNVFPILTNAIMLPMFFLSGAMYPLEPAPTWMKNLAHLDPVAYAVDLLRGALLGREHMFFGSPELSVAVLCGCIVALTWSAVNVFRKGEELDLTGPTKFTWRK